MSWDPSTPNTGTALAAMSPESVRILWDQTVYVNEQTEDFFAPHEGTALTSPIVVINDTSVGKGLKFRLTNRAGYFGPGKSGDNTFDSVTDFEPDLINNNEVDADYLRNATSISKRADEFMGTMNEIRNGQAAELGKWMGREKSARAGMTFKLKGGPENLLHSNRKATQDLLVAADGLTYNDILYMANQLAPLGGKPCEVGTFQGEPVKKYLILGTRPGLFSLKQDSSYQDLIKNAMPREKFDANPLWKGGYPEIDGHSIRELDPIDNDGDAWVGSWWNPKAFLGVAITAGTAVIDITGGGIHHGTRVQYFRFFSNYAFEFLPSDIYTPDYTVVRYLLIVNPTNAAVDPGLCGMYSYTTGNDGKKITILNRLGSVNAGATVTTLGGVTWNTGVWSGHHTTVHPVGSTIVQCNALGQPIGDTVMVGAMAMLRGYGSIRNGRTQQPWEGTGTEAFQMRTFITSVFGQALRKNVNNVYPGYVRLRHAIFYPQLPIPTVV